MASRGKKIFLPMKVTFIVLLGFIAVVSSEAKFPIYWNVAENVQPPIDVTQFGFTPRNWSVHFACMSAVS